MLDIRFVRENPDAVKENISAPICLDSLLRFARRSLASPMAARYSASSAMTSSTRGSLASWNFFLMFSLTAR